MGALRTFGSAPQGVCISPLQRPLVLGVNAGIALGRTQTSSASVAHV